MKPWLVKFKKDFNNKKVLILGLGILGRGAADARFFAEIGAQVTVTDLKPAQELKTSLKKLINFPIKFVLGKHRKEDILKADLILRNAGVPLKSPFLELARENNIPVAMDEALFAQYAPVRIVGITGTRGKSTTTTLIYQILRTAGFSVWLAGNIREKAALPLMSRVNKDDWIVMELSSWQLQGFAKEKISPHIAVFTNIYPDHLNRYSSMKEYIEDKKAIFKYQTQNDFVVLNSGSAIVKGFAKQVKSKVVWFDKKDFPFNWRMKIKGGHNKLNAAAAVKTAEILGINKQIIKKTIEGFNGLAHRLETVSVINKVDYINDSTSTTPAAGIAALNSVNRPVILIAGGNSKNLDMESFAKNISQKVKRVLFLEGNETDNLIRLVKKFKGTEKISGRFRNLRNAVLKAKKIAKTGDVILLSPGCTSFGTFVNEFERGEKFSEIVYELADKS